MGTHWGGSEGTVKLGSNVIAEIVNFSLTETVDPIDDSSMGDTYRSHIAGSGLKEWSAEITCHWDETDTNGQQAMTVGASVTLNLYPEGATTGDSYMSGTASIIERGLTVPMDGETIRQSFKLKGNGTLTRTTV